MKKSLQIFVTTFLLFCYVPGFSKTRDSLNVSPNPVDSSTVIHFYLAQPDTITLVVFNMWGEIVLTFYETTLLQSGSYNINWPDNRLVKGTYYVFLDFGSRRF